MAQSALINVIRMAAERAARGLLRDFGEVENLQVSRKGVADFVSNADLDAEKIIVTEKAHPKKSLIGTISYMPAIFGCVAASVVIRDLADLQEVQIGAVKKVV